MKQTVMSTEPMHTQTITARIASHKASRPTWLEIDTGAICANVRRLRARIGPTCRLAAVVKANAYGHGAAATAHACLAGGADAFAVAALDEALLLRESDIHAPILVLGYTPPRHAPRAIEADITSAIYDLEGARALAQAAQQAGKTATVHVKVNTGMNRLGIAPAGAVEFLDKLNSEPMLHAHLHVEGIFTHFATADTDLDFARIQFADFTHLLDQLTEAGLRPPLAHAANSAATLTLPETHLDMVRCGISIYGLHPDAETSRLPDEFEPALGWKAEIAQVSAIAPGASVSYGREYIADRPRSIAVIPVGYADGFPRRPRHWEHVLVNGVAAPIVGRVCMDQTIVDVTAAEQIAPVRQGDIAVLIGSQGQAEITADQVAARLGTINYDVVSRILARVPRIEINPPPSAPSTQGSSQA